MTPQEYRDALNLAHKNMNHLEHHGIKGQRWGIRRFQNEDGTYTDLGAERRREESGFERISPNDKSFQREIRSLDWKNLDDYDSNSSNRGSGEKSRGLSDRARKAIKIGAIAAGSALAVYGGYKIHQKLKDKKLGTDSLPFDVRKDILPFAKGGKIKEGLKSFGEGTKKVISDGAKEAGKASVAAAIAAIGTIAIRKLSNRFADNEEDSQRDRDLNYIAREASIAAVKSGTSASTNRIKSGTGTSNNASTSTGQNSFTSVVGAPKRVHQWSGQTEVKYQNIMGKLRGNEEAKSLVRKMRKDEYDIDQIEKYANEKYGDLMKKNFKSQFDS
ncbi:MAG: hypothetical protein J6Y02_13520 [Pseudobutyrivibrio sp.]|nr:hypothetical protein [Pseudobutyrivibrio sp.]